MTKIKTQIKIQIKIQIIVSIITLIIICILMVQAFINSINNNYSTIDMIKSCSPLYVGILVNFLICNSNINKLNN
ncbi:MAG: hypothetical protein R3Y29_03860 [bacterium]